MRIVSTDVLIIDEVSMISHKVFSQLHFICRSIRANDYPFGGIQLILSGDFRQLKPVPNANYHDSGDYCFNSDIWKLSVTHTIVLDSIMRQCEPNLIRAIHELSSGEMTEETVAYLSQLQRPLPPMSDPLLLFARNFDVEMTCYDYLEQLQGPQKIYQSKDTGDKGQLKHIAAPKYLVLKNNCKVMLIANLSSKLVNGSMGKVCELREDSCIVDFDGVGQITIGTYVFSSYSQQLAQTIATRTQLPLKLAYAITMHKAQGMNLKEVSVDCRMASQPGQLATAVGRAKTSQGLQLKHVDSIIKVKQPQPVLDFYANMPYEMLQLHDAHTCCKFQVVPNVQVDFPLGQAPLVQGHQEELLQAIPVVSTDDGDVPDFEPDDIDDIIAHLSISCDDSENGHQPINVIPDCVSLIHLRTSVTSAFSMGETEQQNKLIAADSKISEPKFAQYASDLWSQFLIEFEPVMQKGRGNIQNKDVSKFMVKFDKFSSSPDHKKMLISLFGHSPDRFENRLAYKYVSGVLQQFLSYKEKVSRPTMENVDMTSSINASDAAKCGIRYLAGYSFAKTRYNNCERAMNNKHKASEKETVHNSRTKVSLIERHIPSQNHIEQYTNEPATLELIKRKQNLRLSLTHVTDDAFAFFQLVDDEVSKCLTRADLATKGGDIFVHATRYVLQSPIIYNAWGSLFWPSEYEDSFMKPFLEETVSPYLHVKFNQFRKDTLDDIRDTKGLEIRKALFGKSSQGVLRPKRVSFHKPTAKKFKSAPMTVIEQDTSPDLNIAHAFLKSICQGVSETYSLLDFTKDNLKCLCSAYNLKVTSKQNKQDLSSALSDIVQQSNSVPNPSGIRGTATTSAGASPDHDDYVCPICRKTIMDDSFWVGCDNTDCNAYVCRTCASLEDDETYRSAVNRHWECPLCSI